MPHCLLRRMQRYGGLSEEARFELSEMSGRRRRDVPYRRDLVPEGGGGGNPAVIIEGWAYRYRILPDGRRSINAVLLPGDIADPGASGPRRTGQGICAGTNLVVGEFRREELACVADRHEDVARALSTLAAVEAAIAEERVVSLGQRTAGERVGHFLCETAHRLRTVGLGDRDGYPMPMTQGDMADAMGLTNVHVNRTLQALRSAGFIALKGRKLSFPDMRGLEEMAMFDGSYLGPEPEPARTRDVRRLPAHVAELAVA